MTQPSYGEHVPQADTAWPGRLAGWPTFAREVAGTLAVRAQYVLHGNIRDLYLIPAAERGRHQPVRPGTGAGADQARARAAA